MYIFIYIYIYIYVWKKNIYIYICIHVDIYLVQLLRKLPSGPFIMFEMNHSGSIDSAGDRATRSTSLLRLPQTIFASEQEVFVAALNPKP